MAVYSLTVNGVEREIAVDRFDIRASLNGPDTMAGDFVSADASFRAALGDEIVFTMDAVRKFAGFITGARERGVDGPGGEGGDGIVTEIVAEDYSGQTRRRSITVTIDAGQTVKQALQSILGATSLDGVVLAAGQVNGPTFVEALAFKNTRVADALQAVVDAANDLNTVGWYWRIDYDGNLRAFEPGAVAAPFDLIEGDGTECGDVEVEDSRSEDYANQVIVDGGIVMEDGHNEQFISDGISATYQLEYTPLQWWVVVVSGIYYETIGTSPALWTIDPAAKTITRVAGVLAASTTVSITFNGMLEVIGTASNGTAAASPPTNVWETRVAVDGLTTIAQATAKAQAILAGLSASNRKATYPTYRSGLTPGQTQTMTSAKRNLSGAWLITDVLTIYDGAAGTDGLRYTVTASEGGVVKGDFRSTYRHWDEVPDRGPSVAVAGGEPSPIIVAGQNTEVQFNDNGALGADAGFVYDQAAKSATVSDVDATIIARGKAGGTNFGLGLPAAFVARVTDEDIYSQAWSNDVAGASKALVLRVADDGSIDILHPVSAAFPTVFQVQSYAQINFFAGRNLYLQAGDTGHLYETNIRGLTGLAGLAFLYSSITATTYTIDVGISSGGTTQTIFLFDPTADCVVSLPALGSHNVTLTAGHSRILFIRNDSTTFTVTLDPDGTELINDASTLVLQPGQGVVIMARTSTVAGWKILASTGIPVKLDDNLAPDDNTDLNVSTSAHGLTPRLPNDATKFLDGTGAYTVPSAVAGGGGSVSAIDVERLSRAQQGLAVYSGCAVTEDNAGAGMDVDVAAGHIRLTTGAGLLVTAGEVTLATADVTNPRIDLVWVDNTGTLGKTDGTPAATPEPPSLPANSVLLAIVSVPANDTTITNSQITDKRTYTMLPQVIRKTSTETVNASTTFQNDDALVFTLDASDVWQYEVTLFAQGAIAADLKTQWTVPAGATYGDGVIGQTSAAGAGNPSDVITYYGTVDHTFIGMLGVAVPVMVILRGVVVNSTTAGVMQLQWAQQVSDATNTQIITGSHVRAWRIS